MRLAHRAFDEWLADPGARLAVPDPYALPRAHHTIETSRRLPRTTFDPIERTFDPHGIHSARLIGRMLCYAVVQRWIARSQT